MHTDILEKIKESTKKYLKSLTDREIYDAFFYCGNDGTLEDLIYDEYKERDLTNKEKGIDF